MTKMRACSNSKVTTSSWAWNNVDREFECLNQGMEKEVEAEGGWFKTGELFE